MKCRLLSSAARTDRGALLTFIRKKTFSGSSKPHGVWGDTLIRSIAVSPTAHSSGYWHVPACDCRKRSISGCKTSLRMVLSFDILNSAKADCCRSFDHTSCVGALSAEATRLCPLRRSHVRWLAKTQAVSARRLRCISQNYRDDRPSASFGPSAAHDPCVATHICRESP